jgi:hypothetical protein
MAGVTEELPGPGADRTRLASGLPIQRLRIRDEQPGKGASRARCRLQYELVAGPGGAGVLYRPGSASSC